MGLTGVEFTAIALIQHLDGVKYQLHEF